MTRVKYVSSSFSEEKFRETGSFVAVVMNFNKRGLVTRAVESAFAQDWPCYEILALDDASTDGSDGEMVAGVKAAIAANPRKAVRVTAVVNDKNLTILGQWRQALVLSDGEWFGMFAGDDEAFPCRIRAAAKIAAEEPNAAGICTNYCEGASPDMRWPRIRQVKRASEVSWPGAETMLGCTAFWRRRLLALDLPDGNMDDFMLTWISHISKAGDLVWAMDISTVRYLLGTGVTTVDRAGVDESGRSLRALYGRYRAIQRRGRRFGRNVWETIREYDERYGSDAAVSRQVRGYYLASWTEGGGWFERARSIWTMLVTDGKNDYGGDRRKLVRKAVRRFVAKFLGPLSFVPLLWISSGVEVDGK